MFQPVSISSLSLANVQDNGSPVPAPAVIGGSEANTGATGYAQLTADETGQFSAVAATSTANGVPVAEIPVINGSATAIWEVINTNPAAVENLKFAVYVSYTANPGQNTPSPGTVTANLSYAPSPPVFTANNGAAASSTLTVPRFLPDQNAARDVVTITGVALTPSLSLSKTHSADFAQGQDGAVYTLTVSNAASAAATNGTLVTLTDTLPSGLAATAISGNGWSCTLTTLTCSRSDVLAPGSSYPPVTLTVHVGLFVSSPQINQAGVSGGGSLSASVTDPTVVTAPLSNPNPPIGSAAQNSLFLSCPSQAAAAARTSAMRSGHACSPASRPSPRMTAGAATCPATRPAPTTSSGRCPDAEAGEDNRARSRQAPERRHRLEGDPDAVPPHPLRHRDRLMPTCSATSCWAWPCIILRGCRVKWSTWSQP